MLNVYTGQLRLRRIRKKARKDCALAAFGETEPSEWLVKSLTELGKLNRWWYGSNVKWPHDDIYADIRAYLLDLFPTWEVVQGYSNNVPLPNTYLFLMNIINRNDVSTNVHKYDKAAQIATVTRTVETA